LPFSFLDFINYNILCRKQVKKKEATNIRYVILDSGYKRKAQGSKGKVQGSKVKKFNLEFKKPDNLHRFEREIS